MFIEALSTVTRDRLATIRHDALLIDAAKQLSRAKINLVVVCNDDETLAGVITKTDLVRQIGVCRGSACTAAASSVMTSDVTSCRRTSWLADVWKTMRERGLKHVPVINDAGQPLGVLYARDALQALLTESESEELLLREYVLGIGYR